MSYQRAQCPGCGEVSVCSPFVYRGRYHFFATDCLCSRCKADVREDFDVMERKLYELERMAWNNGLQ